MARIRTVKPELASDVKLAALPADVRWTFILCISQADDMGLLYASPRVLLGTLYPVTDGITIPKLTRWIGMLVAAGLLRRVDSVDGTPLLQVTNWRRHQKVEKPHYSVISRSMVPHEPVGHNSMMNADQIKRLWLTIDAAAERHRPADSPNDSPKCSPNDSPKVSPNDSPKVSPNRSRRIRDRIRDKGQGIVDEGRGTTEQLGDSPAVLSSTRADTAGAIAPEQRTTRPARYPYTERGAA